MAEARGPQALKAGLGLQKEFLELLFHVHRTLWRPQLQEPECAHGCLAHFSPGELPQNPEASSQQLCQTPSSSNLSLPGLLVLQSAECIPSSLRLPGTVQPPASFLLRLQTGPGLQREMVGSVELRYRPAARAPSAQGQAWRLHQGRREEGNLAQMLLSLSWGTEARGACTPFLSRSAVPTAPAAASVHSPQLFGCSQALHQHS